ncbi:MAG TPA: hypothetical protein VNH11_25140 [Pirellulales bacterium]|nr:hypothetical protein [Pirellulales bacterium]
MLDTTENRYWPFDVLSPEQRSEDDRRVIHFLETAFQAGYKPYMFASESFGATSEGRAAEIIYRGCRGKHWELFLVHGEELVLSAHLDDFGSAAESLLRWLGGDDGAEIVELIRGHLFSTEAAPSGFVLHGRNAAVDAIALPTAQLRGHA